MRKLELVLNANYYADANALYINFGCDKRECVRTEYLKDDPYFQLYYNDQDKLIGMDIVGPADLFPEGFMRLLKEAYERSRTNDIPSDPSTD